MTKPFSASKITCRLPAPDRIWLERFPALKAALCDTLEQDKIELPYYTFDSLYKDHVVLPLDIYEKHCLPAWLLQDAPLYFYSSLVLFNETCLITFDKDFSNHEEFVQYLVRNINVLEDLRWGIKVLASKLPHPIAASRETCFHLGHDDLPMPTSINLSLTNICNLRCTICGSQAYLSGQNIARESMTRENFEKIAHTLFPFCNKVELNSLGEPTLHKDFACFIELINQYDCELRLQTNGTNLNDSVLRSLQQAKGCLSLSIDATGTIFEQQRVNASWEKVEANVRKLLTMRNSAKLEVNLFPTLTRRTIADAVSLCQWAEETGVDRIYFHYYEPIANGIEEPPTNEEKIALEQKLLTYMSLEAPRIRITLQYKNLEPQITGCALKHMKRRLSKIAMRIAGNPFPALRHYINCTFRIIRVFSTKVFMRLLRIFKISPRKPPVKFPSYRYYNTNMPIKNPKSEGAHPSYICGAPLSGAFIGLTGDISPCCRTYNTIFGSALSNEAFFDCWFGEKMETLRKSFLRENPVADYIPECQDCIALYWANH